MTRGEYLEGVAFFVPPLLCALIGAWLLTTRRFPWTAGALRAVVFTVLTVAGVLAIHLAPLTLGVLGRETVLVAGLLWLAAMWRVPAVEGRPDEDAPDEPDEPWALRIVGLGCVVLAFLYGLAVMKARLTTPPTGVDAMTFHLPTIASWIEQGTLWQIPVFAPQVSPGHYPNTGDVLLMSTVLPWDNDFLTHLTLYPLWGMTVIAVYALARELRAPRSAAMAAGALVVLIPAVAVPALVSELVDIVALFGIAVGLTFLVRHHRSGRTSELVVAGVALGIAFGTKWYAVSNVAAIVGVWALARLIAGAGLGTVVRQGLAMTGLVTATGGIWLLRNLVESGNPFHPVKLEPFGITIFDAPHDEVREHGGATIADYLGKWDDWDAYILPQLRDALGVASMVLAAAVLAGIVLALVLRGRPSVRGTWGLALAGGVMALLITAIYSITPYTAGGPDSPPFLVYADARYVVVALVIGAPLAAWVAGRWRYGPLVLGLLALGAFADTVDLTTNGERSSGLVSSRDWMAGAVVLIGAIAVVGAVRWIRATRPSLLRPALGGGAVVALVVAVAAFSEVEQDFNEGRYSGIDPVIDYVLDNAPSGHRIGLAGIWSEQGISPIWPVFGPRMGNHVAYVGRLEEDVLQRFPDEQSFIAAVREGDYDLLIVGSGRPGQPPAREPAWARAAGYEPVTGTNRFGLYRRTG